MSFTISWSLLKLMSESCSNSFELVMPFNHIILWTRDCGLCLIEGAVGDQDGAKGYTLEILS